MNGSFGIDHPLFATNDIGALRARLIELGFNMTTIGKHPWGTSTSLAMFEGCLIEIMGIYDDTLLDEKPAGDFYFGRHVHRHLCLREGIALSALHSTDSVADAGNAEAQGFCVAGHLEFGRDVTLPNGLADRTKTTLALLPDPDFPRLSFFLCQQHRPELIYVPEWLNHPNGAFGIAGITIMAKATDHKKLRSKLENLYGTATSITHGFSLQTANGSITVLTPMGVAETLGHLPPEVIADTTPAIIGMDIRITSVELMEPFLATSTLPYVQIKNGFRLTDPSLTANSIFRFIETT
jgi:hypothetical protein